MLWLHNTHCAPPFQPTNFDPLVYNTIDLSILWILELKFLNWLLIQCQNTKIRIIRNKKFIQLLMLKQNLLFKKTKYSKNYHLFNLCLWNCINNVVKVILILDEHLLFEKIPIFTITIYITPHLTWNVLHFSLKILICSNSVLLTCSILSI